MTNGEPDIVPHVQEFSNGYYVVDGLYVVPNDDADVPLVQDHIYAHIQDYYYGDRPTPILFRHNNSEYHFEVHPDESVRIDTVEMPFEMTADMDIGSPPREEQFLMTKPQQAHMLYRMKATTIEG